jgi:putative endonuclease
MKNYWVHIMSGRTKTLYVGVTKDIEGRNYEHKNKSFPGFTSKYRLDRLLYFEEYSDIGAAIEREKQIKAWRREKKVTPIESVNSKWRDLSLDWHSDERSHDPNKSPSAPLRASAGSARPRLTRVDPSPREDSGQALPPLPLPLARDDE